MPAVPARPAATRQQILEFLSSQRALTPPARNGPVPATLHPWLHLPCSRICHAPRHHQCACSVTVCVSGIAHVPVFHLAATMGVSSVPVGEIANTSLSTSSFWLYKPRGNLLARALGPHSTVRRQGDAADGCRPLAPISSAFRSADGARNAEVQVLGGTDGSGYPSRPQRKQNPRRHSPSAVRDGPRCAHWRSLSLFRQSGTIAVTTDVQKIPQCRLQPLSRRRLQRYAMVPGWAPATASFRQRIFLLEVMGPRENLLVVPPRSAYPSSSSNVRPVVP